MKKFIHLFLPTYSYIYIINFVKLRIKTKKIIHFGDLRSDIVRLNFHLCENIPGEKSDANMFLTI